MPARVHALLVVRADDRAIAAQRLSRTLDALHAQSRPVDALTIVLCGRDAAAEQVARESGADQIIAAPRSVRFAAAVDLAAGTVAGEAVWLLAQDTAPEPTALARLSAALDVAPSVAIAAPKLVRWNDPTRIVSLGVSMTARGRRIGLADGEFDQGQYDATEDVLGADVRAMLIRTEAWSRLERIDPALAGTDEGLDLGVRARLGGGRVRVVPAARVTVHGDGVAELPGLPPRHTAKVTYARRRAQLHRRMAYAHAAALIPLWLAILPVALWRTAGQLIAKLPGRIVPEWGAAFATLVRWGRIRQARRRIHHNRDVSWAQLAGLRVGRDRLRTSTDHGVIVTDARRAELRFFSGGGAWATLAALVVSIAMFPSLLVWPALGGGALAPLRATVSKLWSDASFGLRPTGLDEIGPADPFSSVIALLGSFWPGDPSRMLVVLWLLALPLAVLGAWFAATRVTERSVLRITAAVVWALAPTFLTALAQGRPAAVLLHLLLPWVLFVGVVAHRSWGASGAASVLLVGVVACAPVLAPAVVLLWVLYLVGVFAARRGHGAARVIWLLVPSALFAVPVVWYQLVHGSAWGLLSDPGKVWAGPQAAADAAGRAAMAAGSPTMDPGGWGQWLGTGVFGSWGEGLAPAWALVLLVPLGVLAVLAVFTRRWLAGAVGVFMALVGVATAIGAAGVAVASAGGQAVAIWPGTGLSLAWAGVTAAAILTIDTGVATGVEIPLDEQLRAGRARAIAATVVMVTVGVFAVPMLTAHLRGVAVLDDGPSSTLPAFVAAEGRSNPDVGTVILHPLRTGALSARVVWGESETLGGESTVLNTRERARANDEDLAELAADLATPTSSDVVERLTDEGIGFVLLTDTADAPEGAGSLGLSAQNALNQRDGLDAVGKTTRGTLWRVTAPVAHRAHVSAATAGIARTIGLVELAAIAAGILLAIPTSASRARARQLSRVVGRRRMDAGPDPLKEAAS